MSVATIPASMTTAPVKSNPPLVVSMRRIYLWGKARGFPRTSFAPHLAVMAGEEQWRRVRQWSPDDVARMLAVMERSA